MLEINECTILNSVLTVYVKSYTLQTHDRAACCTNDKRDEPYRVQHIFVSINLDVDKNEENYGGEWARAFCGKGQLNSYISTVIGVDADDINIK